MYLPLGKLIICTLAISRKKSSVPGHQLFKTELRTLTKWDFRFSKRSSHVCVFWDV